MANAAGGKIIYGIRETPREAKDAPGVAESLDEGSDFTPEWIEQIIVSNVEPRIADLTIRRIQLQNGKSAFVVEVGQATVFAPHQSKPDTRYYRRWNTTVQPMLDYEVRDMMRRSTAPQLTLDMTVDRQDSGDFHFAATVKNLSREPALYCSVDLIFDEEIDPKSIAPSQVPARAELSDRFGNRIQGTRYSIDLTVPQSPPIYLERPRLIFQMLFPFALNRLSNCCYAITAPGFSFEQKFYILRNTGRAGISFI